MRRFATLLGFIAWMGVSAGLWGLADSMTRLMPPGTVVNAVTSKFPGASICQTHLRRGTDTYELTVREAGRPEEITMWVSMLGKIERIERSLGVDEIPSAVSRIIESRFSQARISRIRKIDAPGKPTRYAVRISTPRAESLLIDCNPDGEVTRVLTVPDSNAEEGFPGIQSMDSCV